MSEQRWKQLGMPNPKAKAKHAAIACIAESSLSLRSGSVYGCAGPHLPKASRHHNRGLQNAREQIWSETLWFIDTVTSEEPCWVLPGLHTTIIYCCLIPVTSYQTSRLIFNLLSHFCLIHFLFCIPPRLSVQTEHAIIIIDSFFQVKLYLHCLHCANHSCSASINMKGAERCTSGNKGKVQLEH